MSDQESSQHFDQVMEKLRTAQEHLNSIHENKLCGPACQQAIKKKEELNVAHARWLRAQEMSANLDTYKKDYMVMKIGSAAYNQQQLDSATKTVDGQAVRLKSEFELGMSKLKKELTLFKALVELDSSSRKASKGMSERLKLQAIKAAETNANRNVADRLAEYENEHLRSLRNTNTFLYYVLLILSIVAMARLISVRTNWFAPKAWSIPVVLALVIIFPGGIARSLYTLGGYVNDGIARSKGLLVYSRDQLSGRTGF